MMTGAASPAPFPPSCTCSSTPMPRIPPKPDSPPGGSSSAGWCSSPPSNIRRAGRCMAARMQRADEDLPIGLKPCRCCMACRLAREPAASPGARVQVAGRGGLGARATREFAACISAGLVGSAGRGLDCGQVGHCSAWTHPVQRVLGGRCGWRSGWATRPLGDDMQLACAAKLFCQSWELAQVALHVAKEWNEGRH